MLGDKLLTDIVFREGDAVLHIVDTATRFSVATVLDKIGAIYGQIVEMI